MLEGPIVIELVKMQIGQSLIGIAAQENIKILREELIDGHSKQTA